MEIPTTFSDDYYINSALRSAIIYLDDLESKEGRNYSKKEEFVRIYKDRTEINLYEVKIGKQTLINKRGYSKDKL